MLDAGVPLRSFKEKMESKCYHIFLWNAKGIHIIDLNKTQEKLEETLQQHCAQSRNLGKKKFCLLPLKTSERNRVWRQQNK